MVTTTATSNNSAEPFRSVTAEEIAHYKSHGWVRLKRFLPQATVDVLLSYAKERMGEDGATSANPGKFSFFNSLAVQQPHHPLFGPIIRHFGKSAVALRDLKVSPGIRYFKDSFGVKLPSNRADGHGRSDWHQDFAAQVSDRSGGMVFWSALIDMTPDKGTMAFLDGSHRHGVMGDYRTYGEGNLLDAYPGLIEECPSSGYLTLSAGDVTVHSDMCVHSAGKNVSDGPRWTYLVQLNPADARWTGAPSVSFDTSSLTLLNTLDEERFPTVG
ncbi:phytanoyl-CoA dioxygenase family protein [Sphingobium lactosutens]|uniref:phytanoyl-CoA dioxygenase family protein n=1 Tax=Sphingobium lactosutens TaxID=522773 RepID=UPI0015BE5FBE|nr:phytanoyl-CoA dioxygenase family protein [Sphingobium lactosutens]